MSALLLAAALSVAVSPQDYPQSEPVVAAAPRTVRQWHDDVHAALRAQALAEPADEKATVLRLLALYRGLDSDGVLIPSERKRLQSRLRARLLRVREELVQNPQVPPKRADQAAQPVPARGGPRLPDGVLGQIGGGAAGAGVFAGGGAPPGNGTDYGEDLVDLIQKTIAPDSWDVNGGNGSAVYFRPLHALIIRNEDEVHRQIGGLVGGLRQAQ